uniref:Uncharacterized protein n=1 Tax=Geospiza parvula TaxID=87175 RepID=A0A8U8B4S0_GEOPR
GCVCDSGYLLYNDRCVPSQQCGCWHNGQHYPVGSEFWTDNTCSSKCTCPARGSKVQCFNASCPAGQYCGVQNGKPVCLEHSYGICHVHGDPHYQTFDKVTHNFMGNCTYTLAKVCSNTTSLPYFNVEAKNEHRGSTQVSYVREVVVEVYGQRIEQPGRPGTGPGPTVTLPVSAAGGAITVSKSGRYIVLETDFSLRVSYDADHSVEVKVPTTYFNLTCGMCGNFNNRRDDEYMMPNGQQAADSNALGESWQVPDSDPSCGVPVPSPPCSAEEEKLYRSEQFCGILTTRPSSFESCHGVINPQDYFDTCLYDLCALNGGQEFLCAALEAYADACQAAGVTLLPWRNATFCPLQCPPNSYYDPCMTGCPATCVDQQAPQNCSKPCVEGCACSSGFLLSGDTCVPEANCGCHFEGSYYTVSENPALLCRPLPGHSSACTFLPHTLRFGDEVCKVQDGQRGCYPASTAVCHIYGDPHYSTFDGKLHHFQGSCNYTAVTGCDNSSVGFSVTTPANEHRGGNTRVSYVRYVDVDVADQRIRLGQGGVVMVNGVEEILPCSPSAGVQVVSSGFYTMVMTDFGLRVKFDGKHRVEVTLPSTFGQKVCGMCGNYNGIAADDFQNPEGTMEPDSTSLGNSWEVSNNTEPLPTPACNETDKQLISSSHFCGLLNDTSGPFQVCHAVLSPSSYFDTCSYDLCELGLDRETLCKSLQSYADACQSLGVHIPVWRNATFSITCPANSHYEPCAAACPATCVDPTAPDNCSLPCVEGCVCDSGYLLYNDRCVPSQQCGCWHNGQHYPVGSEFWTDNTCSSKCTCPARGSKVQCFNASCPAGQYCGVQNGKPVCLEHSYGICHVHGDPHYQTFDKVTHNFMGNCTYTLAKVCSNTTSLPYFNVEAKNEHRGSTQVSYVREVVVEVYGQRIVISQEWVGSLKADGCFVFPFGRGWRRKSQMGNMCHAEHSAEPSTQLREPQGCRGVGASQTAVYSNALGESWQVPDSDPSCGVPVPSPPCSAEEEKLYRSEQFCGILTTRPSSFESCHGVINPQDYFDTCLYDLCALNGGQEFLCAALEAYADACQAAGVTLLPWRNATFCPLQCPPNSYYDPCMTGCPATCVDQQAPQNCSKPCVEGCACSSGFLLSGDTCVPEANCGCHFEGNYYTQGESSVNENCTRRCWCEGKDQMVCSALSCGEDEVCKVQDGQRGCYPASTAVCHIYGDPHYSTFDGKLHHFQGSSTLLAHWHWHYPGEEQRPLTGGHLLMLLSPSVPLLQINGALVSLPASPAPGVTISLSGSYVRVSTKLGLQLQFNGDHELLVKVSEKYKGKLCGLCGTYTGSQQDDFMRPDGVVVPDFNDFGTSWRVPDDECPPASCSPAEEEAAKQQCSILTHLAGPFQPCHAVLPPKTYFESCVYDQCATGGSTEQLCNDLGAYAAACAEAGVALGDWSTHPDRWKPCPALCLQWCGECCGKCVTCPFGSKSPLSNTPPSLVFHSVLFTCSYNLASLSRHYNTTSTYNNVTITRDKHRYCCLPSEGFSGCAKLFPLGWPPLPLHGHATEPCWCTSLLTLPHARSFDTNTHESCARHHNAACTHLLTSLTHIHL